MSFHQVLEALSAFRRTHKACEVDQLSRQDNHKPVRSYTAVIRLPWCKHMLVWHVVFQTQPPFTAPDFIFDDDSYLPLCGSLRPDQARHLTHLLHAWGPTCASSNTAGLVALFASIMAVLLAGFKEHQLSRMMAVRNERLQFELSMLPDLVQPQLPSHPPLLDLGDAKAQEGAPDTNPGVEALLADGKAHLSLPLTGVDMRRVAAVTHAMALNNPALVEAQHSQGASSQEGPASQEAQSLCQECRLHVAFSVSDARAAPDLSIQLPVQLQGVGGCVPPLSPSWEPHSSLLEVIPQVVSRMQPVLDTWATHAMTRCKLIDALTSNLGGGPPVELNLSEGIAQWALSWDSSPLLVTLNCCAPASVAGNGGLPLSPSLISTAAGTSTHQPSTTTTTSGASFPEEKPLLVVTNMRLMLMQAGVHAGSSWWRDYPWSPRWTPTEMAARITAFLRQEIPKLLAPTMNAIPVLVNAAVPSNLSQPTAVKPAPA